MGIEQKILNNCKNLLIGNFTINISSYDCSTHSADSTTCIITIESDTDDPIILLNQAKKKYRENMYRHNSKVIYHFKYTGNNSWTNNIIHEFQSDSSKEPIESFETFNNIHNEHKDLIIKDIDRLNKDDYYKRTGLRRKKSYLFYGEPGTGKTSMVTAMALYDFRHIIEIPMSLIKTNSEFETIMNTQSINGIGFNKNNVIYLFDEIDVGVESLNRTNSDPNLNKQIIKQTSTPINLIINNDESKKNPIINTNPDDKLNIGTLLSKFDGIGTYHKLIIVATTNYIDKIDPSLCRELRLTKINFTKLRKQDCVEIIEKFFDTKLTPEQIDKIPDRAIVPAKLIYNIEKYLDDSIDNLISEIFA